MIRYLFALSILFVLFFSSGKIDNCSANECSSTGIELCMQCEHIGNTNTSLPILNLQPILKIEKTLTFNKLNLLKELSYSNSVFRPPIS